MTPHRASPQAARPVVAALFFVVALVLDGTAQAQDAASVQQRAAEAYDAGIVAFGAGDYARAGDLFARANLLAPSPIALAQAVRAYLQANQVRKAGTLALRLLAQEGIPPVLRDIAEGAVAEARQWYVRIDVDCSSPCTVAVDGTVEESTRFFALPDRDLRITARFRAGDTDEEVVHASPGEARLVVLSSSRVASGDGDGSDSPLPMYPRDLEAAALASGENPYRISRYRYFSRPRAAFFAVLGPTAVGLGMLTWSGVDARHSREELRALQASGTDVDRARAEVEHDRDVRRTRWLALEVGGFLGATALIAALTDWTPYGNDDEEAPETEASVSVTPEGVLVSAERHF